MWLAALFIFFLYKIIKNPSKKEDFAFSITWVGIVFILIAILVVCVLFLDNYRNGIIQKDGSVRLNMHYLDGFVRNAVVRELLHNIPPQMPFAAGFSLSYHHGMDIFVSLFYKHLSIGVLDLLHRLTMTFYFALLLMTVFIFSRKWMRSDKAALLGIFLVVFGSFGLSSFALPGLFRKFFIFRKLDRMRVFLIFFFFIGIIYFFVFSPSLGGRPKNWTNIYVFYLSVIILIFFWSERLVFFLETKKRLLRTAVLSVVIILSIPNVIHFLWAKVHFPQQKVFDSYYMEACTWLNECTKKEDVVIHSSNTAHVCYFVDRRVVLDQSPHSYLTFHLTTDQIKERQNDIHRFFLDPVINADVLDKYKVSHVWVRNKREFMARLPSAFFGILTILALYFAGKLFFSKKEGLVAAALSCVNSVKNIFLTLI